MPPVHAFRVTIAIMIVACLYMAIDLHSPGRLSLLWRRMQHKSAYTLRPYQAPLVRCDSEYVLNGRYCVSLHRGSTLDEHKWTVGQTANLHLDSKINVTLPSSSPRFGDTYCTVEINDQLLDDIRADVAVDMVECYYDGYPGFANDEIEWVGNIGEYPPFDSGVHSITSDRPV